MKRGHQCPRQGRLGCCVGIIALMSCSQLPRTIKIGVTKVAAHEKVRTLKVVPYSCQLLYKSVAIPRIPTELDPQDPLSVVV